MVGSNPQIATYIMASGRNGTLYTGVTSQLVQRVAQHKRGTFGGFSAKYGCKRLVWFERHELMASALLREKQIKHWLRRYKLALIEDLNPDWRDLSDGWFDGLPGQDFGTPIAGPPSPDPSSSGSAKPRTEDPASSPFTTASSRDT